MKGCAGYFFSPQSYSALTRTTPNSTHAIPTPIHWPYCIRNSRNFQLPFKDFGYPFHTVPSEKFTRWSCVFSVAAFCCR
jgi:hypothetical protein